MTAPRDRRALQWVVALACLVPLVVGGLGIARGPGWLGHPVGVPRDLDSHFRYISGIFFGVGIAFVTCIAGIERKTARFRLLGLLVVAGGLSRLVSLLAVGAPSTGHLLGLVMELGVVPLLMGWQASLAARSSARRPASLD